VEGLDAEDQIRLFSLINAAREGRHGCWSPERCRRRSCRHCQAANRPDLSTRLAQGLVFRCSALSDADKIAALRPVRAKRAACGCRTKCCVIC
jgi:hypothetical protein